MSKTVLITGTSSGIGRAAATYFSNRGWNVIATMRRPEKEEELTKTSNTIVTQLDVQQPETIVSAIKTGIEKFGKMGFWEETDTTNNGQSATQQTSPEPSGLNQ